VRLYGDTSGFVELAAPDVSDDGVLTLPTAAQGILAANGGIGSNVVQTVKADTFTTSSTTYVDVTGLSVTITPASSSSLVLVIYDLQYSLSALGYAQLNLVRGSTNIRQSTGATINNTVTGRNTDLDDMRVVAGTFVDSPNTGTAVTYKLQIATGGTGTLRVNGRQRDTNFGGTSSITAIEVAA